MHVCMHGTNLSIHMQGTFTCMREKACYGDEAKLVH